MKAGCATPSMVSNGAVPEQQFSTLIPYMVEKFGKKVYVIAADYNFGQLSAEWNRMILKELGGTVVGEEFIPLGVSQFAQTIQNIQKAKPDWILTINVGAAQDSFFEQAAAAKLNLPMGSSIKIMLGFEHKRFAPPALNNMHAVANWFEEIDTPASERLQEALACQVPERDLHQRHGLQRVHGRVSCTRQLVEHGQVHQAGRTCARSSPPGKACIEAP